MEPILVFFLHSPRSDLPAMGSRRALALLSVACAMLFFVQLAEAQSNIDPGFGRPGVYFPEDGNRRPPPRPTRPSTGGSGCSCPTTGEYNPVCGTNGVSYSNPAKLNCAKRCGQDVSILHYGNCTPPDPNAPSSTTTQSPADPKRGGRSPTF